MNELKLFEKPEYTLTPSGKMELRIPMEILKDKHTLWAQQKIQVYLNEKWILDGDLVEDYCTNELVCRMKKL